MSVFNVAAQALHAQVPGGPMPQPSGDVPLAPQPGATIITAPLSAPSELPHGERPKTNLLKPRHTGLIIIAIVIVVALAATAVLFTKVLLPPTTTTTTTVSQSGNNKISACGTISSPGTYAFASNISTSIASGACINVTASNVQIFCAGDSLSGSGPYAGVPPFTVGIELSGNYETVNGCTIGNFSYGIFARHGANLAISSNNASDNYVSNIYLDGVKSSQINNNKLGGATGLQGGLYVTNGSTSDNVYNNTLLYNKAYGIVINASGNSFYDNYLNGSPYSFYCSVNGGLQGSNKASGNTCSNNSGCSFLECHGINVPTNISKISLSGSVTGCGTINLPGTYNLQQGINVSQLIDVAGARAGGYSVPCIRINSGNVTLNCNGFTITDALVGVWASKEDNVTVNGCSIYASASGIAFYNVTDSSINNVYASGAGSDILLDNSSIDFLTNVTLASGSYGLYLLNSTTDTISKFTTLHNSYGIYVAHSTGNIFNNGKALNNSAFDVYATPDSANTAYNLMTSTACGYTNAAWAPCTSHIAASLVYTPVTSCMTISRPGNYSLTGSIITTFSSCIKIASSNVILSCRGYEIAPAASAFGYAISMSNVTNVTVRGCGISGYAYGINATNSSGITITNVTVATGTTGTVFREVNNSIISKISVSDASAFGIALINSNGDTLTGDNASYSTQQGIGILLNNSGRNLIKSDFGTNNNFGVALLGRSVNNTVSNNSETGNNAYDYVCSPLSGAINAEYGGANFGGNKQGCNWLAVLTPLSNMRCSASFSSNLFSFSKDHVYSVGATCYTVYGNTTTINCNGHTILATNGGLLVSSNNATVKIENCMLKGFYGIVRSTNSIGVSLVNDTIYMNSSSSYYTPINVTGGANPLISHDNISSPYYGVYLSSTRFGALGNNRVYGGTAAYALSNVSGLSIINDLAVIGSGIGMIINSSADTSFQNNLFNGTLFGIECLGRSQSGSAAYDDGGNRCSSEFSCAWISASSATCKPSSSSPPTTTIARSTSTSVQTTITSSTTTVPSTTTIVPQVPNCNGYTLTMASGQSSISGACLWSGGNLNAAFTPAQPGTDLQISLENTSSNSGTSNGAYATTCSPIVSRFSNLAAEYYQVSLQILAAGSGSCPGQLNSVKFTTG